MIDGRSDLEGVRQEDLAGVFLEGGEVESADGGIVVVAGEEDAAVVVVVVVVVKVIGGGGGGGGIRGVIADVVREVSLVVLVFRGRLVDGWVVTGTPPPAVLGMETSEGFPRPQRCRCYY